MGDPAGRWHARPGRGILAAMKYLVELEKENDGRWIAEVRSLSGVMVYGKTRREALVKVQALALRARRGLAALLRPGWSVKRTRGSHQVLARPGWPDHVWAFHDSAEVGPKMLSRIARRTGLRPED